ncbi:hypothetical protein [Serratia sp. FGI94]|uniref:hypothetical protein n=1 Tax=Serratia sp. FGI94 TaxID=671990 RepID=UPI0002D4F104|nr:hypothetical protein [Serratia sp. FGI94]
MGLESGLGGNWRQLLGEQAQKWMIVYQILPVLWGAGGDFITICLAARRFLYGRGELQA